MTTVIYVGVPVFYYRKFVGTVPHDRLDPTMRHIDNPKEHVEVLRKQLEREKSFWEIDTVERLDTEIETYRVRLKPKNESEQK